MVTRQIGVVDVQQREDFDDLLRSLEWRSGSTVTIDVTTDLDVLSEPAEFEALLEVARLHDIELELATDDPIRQELGRIYGMRIVTGPALDPTLLLRGDATTVRMPRVARDEPNHSGSTDEQETEVESTAPFGLVSERFSPFDTDASFSFVVAPPEVRQRPQTTTASARPKRQRRRRKVSRSLGSGSIVVSAVVIASAIAILLTALLAPAADVVIVPESRDLQASVTFGTAGAEGAFDVQVAPMTVSERLTYESTIPATGEQMVPDEAARGMVFLTNPFTEDVHLPAGTLFSTQDASVSYETVEAVQIPAADPFESARYGTGAVGIRAVQPGPGSNLDVAQLTGVHETGILFQNRFPIDGGTESQVSVVTPEDIESLRAAARADLERRASSALEDDVTPGWSMIGEPQIVGDVLAEFSAEAGAEAEEVTITAHLDVEGQIYDPEALEAEARDSLLNQLASQVPAGYGLAMDSLRLSAPSEIEVAEGTGFRVDAVATAAAQFDAEEVERISDELVGHGEGHASRVLASTDGVKDYSVSFGPSWLPWDPIPRFKNRVSVDIRGV